MANQSSKVGGGNGAKLNFRVSWWLSLLANLACFAGELELSIWWEWDSFNSVGSMWRPMVVGDQRYSRRGITGVQYPWPELYWGIAMPFLLWSLGSCLF